MTESLIGAAQFEPVAEDSSPHACDKMSQPGEPRPALSGS